MLDQQLLYLHFYSGSSVGAECLSQVFILFDLSLSCTCICERSLLELKQLALVFFSIRGVSFASNDLFGGNYRSDLSLWYRTSASEPEGISLTWLNFELVAYNLWAFSEIRTILYNMWIQIQWLGLPHLCRYVFLLLMIVVSVSQVANTKILFAAICFILTCTCISC